MSSATMYASNFDVKYNQVIGLQLLTIFPLFFSFVVGQFDYLSSSLVLHLMLHNFGDKKLFFPALTQTPSFNNHKNHLVQGPFSLPNYKFIA